MNNNRPDFDPEIVAIADYMTDYQVDSELALNTAYYDLLDSLACAFQALDYPACTKLLGPTVTGAQMPEGVRVIGLPYQLEPVQAAFNNGALIRWLDFNDTWLAAEWGHPSDNLGTLLSVADYLVRHENREIKVKDLLKYLVKTHEIQGVLALENSFNRVGLDHVILVKVASTAAAAHLLGCSREQLLNAISLAWVDGQSLRTYRHAPNTGSRKSWAAGDACRRAVQLALMARQGEMGYPSALSAPTWGFYDVSFKGQPFKMQRDYGSYVMENVLFKISFPAEFHAQTAVECAIALHPLVKDRLDEIERIQMRTHESAMRIISKQGPLHNPADRDHCLEYMTAIGLIFGDLKAQHYEDEVAKDPRIDALREKMQPVEDKNFSQDYLDPNKRSIANAIQLFFKDGSHTEEVVVEYPVGHKRRREEGIPLLLNKFERSTRAYFDDAQAEKIIQLASDQAQFSELSVSDLMDLVAVP